MGAVYEAWQIALERRVAIKLLPIEAGADAAFAERFRREARTLAKLQHPNIVAVFESGETAAGHLYFVMEYVEGGDLAERAQREPMEPGAALGLVGEISAALACAHAQGVVHRDIKPSNVLLTAEGRAKVADFGLAVLESREPDSKLTLTGIALGTFDYAAPEQLSGRGGEDARSDLYSLGVLAYELLAGKPPRGVFDPPSLANPAVDPAVDAVVLTALQSEPQRRFQSAEDFASALNRARDFRANRLARERELRRKARRRTRLAFAAMLAAAMAAGVAVYAFVQRQNARLSAADAERQRAAAETVRGEAEGLVDYMLNDLRGKLEASDDLTYLTDILARVEKYYAAPANASEDPVFLTRKAEFLRIDGNVREALGDYGKGAERMRAAISIREALLTRDGGEAAHLALVRAWDGLQSILQMSMEHDAAAAAAQTGLGVVAAWQAAHPGSREAALWKVHFAHQIGEALGNKQDFTGASPHWDAALLEGMRLAEQVGREPRLLIKLSNIHASLGSMHETRGELEKSLGHFLKMKELNERAGAGSDNARVTSISFRIGLALRKLGRAAEALPILREAVAAGARYLARKPNDLGRLNTQRSNYAELAAAYEALGLAHDAAAAREQEAIFQRRMKEVPAIAKGGESQKSLDEDFEALRAAPEGDEVQYRWAMASEAEGTRIEQESGPDAAIAYFRSQIERIAEASKGAPEGTWWLLGASFAWNRIGFVEFNRGNFPAAEIAYRSGLDARAKLLVAHPEVDRLSRDAASSVSHLAGTLIEQGRAAEAAELVMTWINRLKDRPNGKLRTWRATLVKPVPAIARKVETPESLLAAAEAFLAAQGEAAMTTEERAVMERLRAEKK
jgi:tetratricopeptide (TPR) repeat protein